MSAVLGTQALDRAFTHDEKRRFAALLRENDYPGARLIALRFAHRLQRDAAAAQDLVGRADLRLMRSGWDPANVTLPGALCRLVWSEWTHVVEQAKAARKAAEGLLHGVESETEGAGPPSPDAGVLAHEPRSDAKAQLAKLKSAFEEARDEVNLEWLEYSLDGIDDLSEMARLSGRNVREFYLAADRRKRHVKRLLAAKNGVTLQKDD